MGIAPRIQAVQARRDTTARTLHTGWYLVLGGAKGLALGASRSTGGLIGHFGLGAWWLGAFTDQEREHILRTYHPMGGSSDYLVVGSATGTDRSAVSLLYGLAGWFTKPDDRTIAHRLLAKAGSMANADTPILDWHFMYHQMIKTYYMDRDDPSFLEAAIQACRYQIALAPQAATAFWAEDYALARLGGHTGYEQLAIILEKQGSLDEAIVLCQQAQAQGWNGEWHKRIDRCRKKAARDG